MIMNLSPSTETSGLGESALKTEPSPHRRTACKGSVTATFPFYASGWREEYMCVCVGWVVGPQHSTQLMLDGGATQSAGDIEGCS